MRDSILRLAVALPLTVGSLPGCADALFGSSENTYDNGQWCPLSPKTEEPGQAGPSFPEECAAWCRAQAANGQVPVEGCHPFYVCVEGRLQCAVNTLQVCQGGSWQDKEVCSGMTKCAQNASYEYACVPACVNRNCGQDNGVVCGTCAGNQYCRTLGESSGSCVVPCSGMNCGTENGVNCGTCVEPDYCFEAYSIKECRSPCQISNCGTDHGVACGTCKSNETCYWDGEAHQYCKPQ